MKILKVIILFLVFIKLNSQASIMILGIAQDAGYPQAGCNKACCQAFYSGQESKHLVSSIAVLDHSEKSYWIIDATPDLPAQMKMVQNKFAYKLKGILLTHAHIGHYTGIMYLGRESMNTQQLPIYVMAQMKSFLENNGPWSQLVTLKNINLILIDKDKTYSLSNSIDIKPVQVPHRDEFSETVGYYIMSKDKKALFIPDIDKWSKWDHSIQNSIKDVDLALLDGTFYKNGEIVGRDMSEIPHPFVEESIILFSDFTLADKRKVKFIHFNHTNPMMRNTKERKEVERLGFTIAVEGEIIKM